MQFFKKPVWGTYFMLINIFLITFQSLKNKISGCDFCMLARDLIVSATGDFELKEAYILDRNEHLTQQQ